MLAAVYQGKNQVECQQVNMREPGDHEVVVKVAACGVCGTDLHIYHGDQGASDTQPGTVLGHEFSGTIVQVGNQVRNLKVGDQVSVDPNDYCGACYYCRMGQSNFCENMIGIGTTTSGGFAEYCTVNAKQAYKIPGTMSLELAAMAEPVGCCLHGIDLCKIKAGQTVLIIGAGTIGLMMLQLAKISGAAQVIVIEPVAKKHQVAYELGADICLDPNETDPAQALRDRAVPPIDVAIECVGLGATVEMAMRLCGRGGTVMMFGLTPPDCEIPLKPFDVFRRELNITASFINPYTLQRALNLIESGAIKIEPLFGARVPLKDVAKVFSDPSFRKVGKVLIIP